MHSCILDLDFWVFENFWGFWDFCEIVGLGVNYLMIYDHALHSISIITMFHAYRCVLDYWKVCAGRFRLGFNPWCKLFLACHMFIHISCIRTLSFLFFFFFFLDCDCVLFIFLSLSLSLSLSDRLRMAPKSKSTPAQNPFGSESSSSNTPLFTFSSVMGRPNRTSLRTFRNMAFI